VKVFRVDIIPTIAVVDDDESIRDALAELLGVFDFECETFGGPEDFLAAHAEGRFDCLITDLNMDPMNGLQLQQKLMSIDPGLPIIFISARSSPEAKFQALRSGAVAFLMKPIDDNVLHRHVITALNRRRSK
jgi:two-component system, LuxR family, response regulator FixJ